MYSLLLTIYTYTVSSLTSSFFFFNAPATPQIYTLSLHDALPISRPRIHECDVVHGAMRRKPDRFRCSCGHKTAEDRKSTRLNSSHSQISYAVFCLKKKKKKKKLNIILQ